MKDNQLDFSNPKTAANAVSNLTSLLGHPGWQLLTMIVEKNMELIREQLLYGTGESETKEFIDRLRDKLKVHKEIINTPASLIDKLTPKESDEDLEEDPYEKLKRT